ncbi:MAG: P-II family nitrogen regulator [Firmicutes bacterium HGW-Firmicutes-7]|nr:MAG: P-II family nitrogen regulator [Firmicutes bacterium HGW-Firmicutes-7]
MADKMTKIDIITRPSKFEDLKEALNDIGITGMTVTQVLGCGMQKGVTEMYRGVPVAINLLPKVKVEMVVCEVPVQTVVDTATAVLKTGEIGDGKIFIYPVENVIKIRTGEEGVRAL